ncbi:hypothetical protein Aperf_G00000007571 [Anoplocephala perfoliata]
MDQFLSLANLTHSGFDRTSAPTPAELDDFMQHLFERTHPGVTELMNTVMHEKPELIVSFVSEPGTLNQPDDFGDTPLHHAARIGSTASVYILFAYGCNLDPLNGEGYTPLYTALENERLDTARMLLFLGASPFILTEVYESALTFAISGGLDLDLLGLMLIQPCPPELKADSLYVALVSAADAGNIEVASMLLEAGANLNHIIPDWEESPLCISIEFGNINMVEFWIEHGAPLERYDEKGLTPLMNAARHGQLRMCELLINNGASIDMASADGLSTALSIANESGHAHVAEYLLNHAVSATGQSD